MLGFLSKRQHLLMGGSLQAQDDQTRAAAEKYERRLAQALAAAILLFRTQVTASVTLSVQFRTLAPIRNAIDWTKLETDLRAAMQPSFDAFVEAAKKAATDTGHPFDGLVADVIAQQRARREALVKRLLDESKRAVDGVVVRGLQTGMRPEDVVRRVKDVIGLNDQQARALQNYRTALEGGNKANALGRALRDERFDDAVRGMRAKPLSPDQIDAMVEAYGKRLVAHRMKTIAGAESTRAANQGAQEAWRQAQAAKPGAEVVRFWLTAFDELVCPVCRSIPLLNPKGVGLNEPFKAVNDGSFMEPPDPHPHCRCSIRFAWKTPANEFLLGRT